MASLDGSGTISYNGFTFTGARIKTRLDVRPYYDGANRTTPYNLYTLHVIALISTDEYGESESDLGEAMDTIIGQLTKPGGQLAATGLGYGSMSVNIQTNKRDCLFGPKPELVSLRPVGFKRAMELNWVVQFAIAHCEDGSLRGVLGQYTEFNFGYSVDVDGKGFSMLSIDGHIAMALNRTIAGAISIPYTADQLRDAITPQVPLGFRLEGQNFKTSPDKARLDFSFRYREIESDYPFPELVIDLEVTQKIRATSDQAFFQRPNVTISGFVEVAKPAPTSLALEKAFFLIRQRLIAARESGKNPFLTSMEFTEHVFGRRIEFSLTYWILNGTPETMLVDTGMFRAVTGTSWESWRTSMQLLVWKNRGIANLSLKPGADVLVDHCHVVTGSNTENPSRILQGFRDVGEISNECQFRDGDYLDWKSFVEFETHDSDIITWAMPKTTEEGRSDMKEVGGGTEKFQAIPYTSNLPAPTSHSFSEREIVLILRGFGVRAGKPVQLPEITKVLGQDVKVNPRLSRVRHATFDRYFGCKLFVASWETRYTVLLSSYDVDKVLRDPLSAITWKTKDGNTK